ncbi:response regulator [Halomonas sp. 18H]|nr:response regulator [Halomonas sp. 18H]MCW4149500.1 response regulator [Halomonas sp. 18H]
MRVESPKEPTWPQLVSPILWPVLLAQLVLVGLGMAITLICWWLMPAGVSWGVTLWLLLALLIGSSLNVTIFLMLLRQRLYRHGQELSAALRQLEERLEPRAEPPVSAGDQVTAMERLVRLQTTAETLVSSLEGLSAGPEKGDQPHSEELESLKSRMRRLEAERERVSESARLKSHYLAHLQQTLLPSLEALEASALPETPCPELVGRLREQLEDARSLLVSLDDSPGPAEEPTARVLIVDDGPVNLMLAQQVLEREGVQVVTASCGREALERLFEMSIDLVLMDIFMADMDGVETCRIWREHEARHLDDAQHRNVVVALTANAGESDKRRFAAAGMDDYLAKPYRPQDILETVRHWLPGALRHDENHA